MGQIFNGDTQPCVFDAHFDFFAKLLGRQRYLSAIRCVLNGVSQQVNQHLGDAIAIHQKEGTLPTEARLIDSLLMQGDGFCNHRDIDTA